MTMTDFDISEVLRIEMNKAIEKTIRKNPTTRILNIDETSTDDIAEYFKKSGAVNQLAFLVETGGEFNLARWFRIVLGELHTLATNKQG
jgi:hypothetical protein